MSLLKILAKQLHTVFICLTYTYYTQNYYRIYHKCHNQVFAKVNSIFYDI